MKICKKCQTLKDPDGFYGDNRASDGLRSRCKECSLVDERLRYAKDPAKKNASVVAYQLRWLKTPKGRRTRREYVKVRRMVDADFKIAHNLRSRTRSALVGDQKSGSAVYDLGCSIPELKQRLESKFQPGMSWDNYGEWHIDHIKPLAKFDLTDREQFLEACHYTNLQPLWAGDNLSKGAR